MKRSKMWMGLLALLLFASPALAEDNGVTGADQGATTSEQGTMQNDQQAGDAGAADAQQGDDGMQQDDQGGGGESGDTPGGPTTVAGDRRRRLQLAGVSSLVGTGQAGPDFRQGFPEGGGQGAADLDRPPC